MNRRRTQQAVAALQLKELNARREAALQEASWLKRLGRDKTKRGFKLRLYAREQHCMWCHDPLTLEEATIEHVVRRCEGGKTSMKNCRIACRWCNQARGAETDPVVVCTRSELLKQRERLA